MPIYVSDRLMYSVFHDLFERIQAADPSAAHSILKSGLVITFNCNDPVAQVTIDARQTPLSIKYGDGNLESQIEVNLSADTLHCILLGDMSIRKAMGRGLLDLKGPIWKIATLIELFRQSQSYYPAILHDYGLPAHCPQQLA